MESESPPRGLEEDEPSEPGTVQPDPPITRSRNAIVSSSLRPLPLRSLGTVTKSKALYYFSSSPKLFIEKQIHKLTQYVLWKFSNVLLLKKPNTFPLNKTEKL
jgi:hypothetical protein